jgi:HAD superfamily hydrolase (TIGR01509 family)
MGGILSRAVLFDMDGVLVDAEPEYRKIEGEIFIRLGIVPTDEDLKGNVGKGMLDVWTEFKKKYGFEEDPEELVGFEARAAREIYLSERLRPVRPAVELLKSCARSGLKVAVATSSFGENAENAIDQLCLKIHVDAIVSGEMVSRTKPSPDIFLLAAELLGSAPQECVVIEDSENGVIAAKAAGMKVIGYKAPGSLQDLSQANIVVESLKELSVKMLEELMKA